MKGSDVGDAQMILEMAERLLSARVDDKAWERARAGEWLGDIWGELVEMGVPMALVPEGDGGFGLPLADALDLVRLAGYHALPLPLAETMIANWLLAKAGLPLADGAATLIASPADRAPWGRNASVLVAQDGEGRIMRIANPDVVATGANMAGQPRDEIGFALGEGGPANCSVLLAGAAIRSLQIAGAMERILDLTITHVSDRQQFGRPLSKFQVVQQELAKLAGEVASCSAAAAMVAEALSGGGDPTMAIAAARVRSGEAVGEAVGIAQQLHGAIGFTREHRLHRFTTALWSWRDEYGGQHMWTQTIGAAALSVGKQAYWQFLTEAA